MPKRALAFLFQLFLGLGFLVLPFANLIGTNHDDIWVWIGIVVGMLLLSPIAVASITGSAHTLLFSGQPGHRRGMTLGYLIALIGGAAIHAGLIALYLAAGLKLEFVLLLFGGAAIADAMLFVAGYRLKTPRIEPVRLRPRATPGPRTGHRPAA